MKSRVVQDETHKAPMSHLFDLTIARTLSHEEKQAYPSLGSIYRVCHTRNKVHTHILGNILKPHGNLTNLSV